MILPEGPRGRWLALGILLIVVGVLVRLIGLPLGSWYVSLLEDRQLLLAELQQAQRIAQYLPALQAHSRQVASRQALDAVLWPGSNRALTAANLQHVVQQQVSRQGGRVLNTRVLPTRQSSALESVSLQLVCQIDVTGLQTLVHALTQHQPLLFFEQVSIQVRPQAEQTSLSVRLVLSGLRHPNQSPGAT
jgi:general secretion pathway protein M